jgi:crotonobetainyl-CoA:carnitine CoA-transferase CaiB-like acyl-CoA transferase
VGQRVEVSLMESMLSLLHPHTSSYLNADVVPGLQGNSAAMISPYDLLQASDRPIYLPGGNDGQVQRLLRIVGRPELIDDPRFRTNPDRVRHRAELLEILQAELCKRPAAEWCRVLWDAGVPVGPVNTIDEVFSDPQVIARQVVVETPHAGLSSGVVRTIKSPAILHDTPAEVRRPPPMLGQHTREVLAELGYSSASLQGLLDKGAARA